MESAHTAQSVLGHALVAAPFSLDSPVTQIFIYYINISVRVFSASRFAIKGRGENGLEMHFWSLMSLNTPQQYDPK